MRNWFSRFFSRRRDPAPSPAPAPPRAAALAVASPAPEAAVEIEAPGGVLIDDEYEFLQLFLDPPHAVPLDEMPVDDRLFVGGIQKRWHSRRLDLPVLPEAAIKLREVLRAGDAPIRQYVALLESDSALNVEVLKAANSALFAQAAPVNSTHDAVLRIGLKRLESILIMAQLKTKVLKGGVAQGKAELLMDLVPPLGMLAGKFARSAGSSSNLSFMRGTLLHVEHLVILGVVADVSREHKRPIKPSARAFHQAFAQFGREIRHAVATSWKLQDILIGGVEEADLAGEYVGFRRVVVSRWLNLPTPNLRGVDQTAVAQAMATIRPRATLAVADAAAPPDGDVRFGRRREDEHDAARRDAS